MNIMSSHFQRVFCQTSAGRMGQASFFWFVQARVQMRAQNPPKTHRLLVLRWLQRAFQASLFSKHKAGSFAEPGTVTNGNRCALRLNPLRHGAFRFFQTAPNRPSLDFGAPKKTAPALRAGQTKTGGRGASTKYLEESSSRKAAKSASCIQRDSWQHLAASCDSLGRC